MRSGVKRELVSLPTPAQRKGRSTCKLREHAAAPAAAAARGKGRGGSNLLTERKNLLLNCCQARLRVHLPINHKDLWPTALRFAN